MCFKFRKTENGVVVPEGSSVFIPVLFIHRSEKYWSEPLKFDPDRFLSENLAERHRTTFLGFSSGPRNCAGNIVLFFLLIYFLRFISLGMVYGMMATKAIVAQIVKNFVIKCDYKSIAEIELSAGIFLSPKNGFKLDLDARM